MFFLIAAMLEKAATTNSDVILPPPDWRTRYEAMVKRRRGNIPAWLLDAAKKLWLQLPSVSLTSPAPEASTKSPAHSAVLPEHL